MKSWDPWTMPSGDFNVQNPHIFTVLQPLASHTLASSPSRPWSPPTPEPNPFRAEAAARTEAFAGLRLQKSSQDDAQRASRVLWENALPQLSWASPPKEQGRTRGTADPGGSVWVEMTVKLPHFPPFQPRQGAPGHWEHLNPSLMLIFSNT